MVAHEAIAQIVKCRSIAAFGAPLAWVATLTHLLKPFPGDVARFVDRIDPPIADLWFPALAGKRAVREVESLVAGWANLTDKAFDLCIAKFVWAFGGPSVLDDGLCKFNDRHYGSGLLHAKESHRKLGAN